MYPCLFSPLESEVRGAMSEIIPSSSANEANEAAIKEEDHSPSENKKIKLSHSVIEEPNTEKLEHRLGGILCCAVCLDLPKTAIYQVINV